MIKKYSYKDVFLSSGFVEKYQDIFGKKKTSVSFDDGIAKITAYSEFDFSYDRKYIKDRVKEILLLAEYFHIRDEEDYLSFDEEAGSFLEEASGGYISTFLPYRGAERDFYYQMKLRLSGRYSLVKKGKVRIEVEYIVEPISDIHYYS